MEKLKSLVKKNTVLKIFSVALAFLLWTYVQIVENPEMSYEVVEVPITITGEADINSEGFVVSTLPKVMKTNVTISATRSQIQMLDTSDLFAFVDVSQCNNSGDFSLPVRVRSNDSEVTVINKSPSTVSIYIDKIITVTKPINISYDGTLDTDYYIDKENIKITPREATIKIPELLSDKVSEVLVSVDMTDVESTVKGDFTGIATSEDGEELYSENLSFVTESINVEIPVLKRKILPLTIDNIPSNVNYALNKDTIEIAGEESKIRYMGSIHCTVKDYNADENRDIYSVDLNIPDGIIVINPEDIILKIERN